MRLFYSLRSPFARRVRLALARSGLKAEDCVIDVFHPTEAFLQANPLGQVPLLLLPSGAPLADSSIILEHLEDAGLASIWPPQADLARRAQVRQASTLAVGLMTYTVQSFLERQKKQPDGATLSDANEVLTRTLAVLARPSAEVFWGARQDLTCGGWDVAIALEYLELREPALDWKRLDTEGSLAEVLRQARLVPFFLETSPPRA